MVVMMYARFPLSLRNVEDLLAERGINICHERVRFWCNRFGPTVLLFTRQFSSVALATLENWFGAGNVAELVL